jgi:DNA primase
LRRGSQVGFLHRAIRASPSSLVLCEGPFSALGAGPDAVATFGKYVTSEQVSRIRNAGVSQVILSVERDAVQDAILAAKECLSLCLRVFLLFLPRGKDPDDLPHEYYVSLKNSAPEVTYPDLEKLRLRLS